MTTWPCCIKVLREHKVKKQNYKYLKATIDILIADNSSHVIETQEKSTLFTRDDIWYVTL